MEFIPVPDPFPNKGPILPEGQIFYERNNLYSEIQTFLQAGPGQGISLVGERKAGKTSLLNNLLSHLPTDTYIPVFIDTQKISPQKDKIFLGKLVRESARAIEKATGRARGSLHTNTLQADDDQVYLTFEEDLENLRETLPVSNNNQQKSLIWMIDEIEVLRGYENTNLFTALRPLAQSDPDFRLLVAGYDVLRELSRKSDWSPFFNAFRHIQMEGLEPDVAIQLVNDACDIMQVTIDTHLYDAILNWTGQKPFFLKWVMSKIADVLNDRRSGRHINDDVWEQTQFAFLNETDVYNYFRHIWDSYPENTQHTILSLIATQSEPYTRSAILNQLIEQKLIPTGDLAKQNLIGDMRRLEELSLLHQYAGNYRFTSGCLKAWIKANKPL